MYIYMLFIWCFLTSCTLCVAYQLGKKVLSKDKTEKERLKRLKERYDDFMVAWKSGKTERTTNTGGNGRRTKYVKR